MLTFTRKIGQSFYIGNNVKVIISRINGNEAKVSIAAPKDVQISREELLTDEQISLIELASEAK